MPLKNNLNQGLQKYFILIGQWVIWSKWAQEGKILTW